MLQSPGVLANSENPPRTSEYMTRDRLAGVEGGPFVQLNREIRAALHDRWRHAGVVSLALDKSLGMPRLQPDS